MILKVLKIFGFYLLLFFIALLAFFSNFPLGKLLDSYLNDINKNLGDYTVSFTEANSGLLGMTIKGLEVRSRDETMEIMTTAVSVSFLNYKLFAGMLPFSAQMYKGEVSGNYSLISRNISFDADKLRISEIKTVRDMQIFNNSPELKTTGNYNLKNNSYALNFELSGASFNGKSSLVPLQILPQAVTFRNINGTVQSENQRIQIKINIEGDFTGQVTGEILSGNNTQMNITVTGTFDQTFMDDNKTVFDLLKTLYMTGNALNVSISGSSPNINIRRL